MRNQANVCEVLPFHDIDDVFNVGVEVDALAQEVRPLAKPGERRRKDLMAIPFEKV